MWAKQGDNNRTETRLRRVPALTDTPPPDRGAAPAFAKCNKFLKIRAQVAARYKARHTSRAARSLRGVACEGAPLEHQERQAQRGRPLIGIWFFSPGLVSSPDLI